MAAAMMKEYDFDRSNSDDDCGSEASSQSEADPSENPTAAAKEFVELLTDLYMGGYISAEKFCLLSYWADKAGMPGAVKQYGVPPGQSPGNYQKKLNRSMGFAETKKKIYHVDTITKSRIDDTREEFQMPMLCPHEVVHEMLADDPGFEAKLQQAYEDNDLPTSYWENHSQRVCHRSGTTCPVLRWCGIHPP